MGDDERILQVHGHPVRVRGYDDLDLVGGILSTTVPFDDLVGLRWDLISPDRVEASLAVGPDHLQPTGVVHGGVYCTLVEAVGSTGSIANVAAKGQSAMGVHNATSFVRPTTSGRLTAVATAIHLGRTQHLWDVRISRDDGRLAAKGELRTVVVDDPAARHG